MPRSIFLSHASTDRSIARQIYHSLNAAQIRCWLDQAEISPGESILQKVEDAIDEMDILGVLLTRSSVNSTWVRAELRMAMTNELQQAKVRVVGLWADDCTIPGFLRDKLYIDLRSDLVTGLEELVAFLHGSATRIPVPFPGALALLMEEASTELWERYRGNRVGRRTFTNTIRSLNEDELAAAVEIAFRWQGYKAFEDGLISRIRKRVVTDRSGARRILNRLLNDGILELADDLDYARLGTRGFTHGPGLYTLKKFAIRSELFEFLPPPPPESLSELLSCRESYQILGPSWFASTYGEETQRRDGGGSVKAVVHQFDPAISWVFSSSADRTPERIVGSPRDTEWIVDSQVLHGESEHVRFAIDLFDDLKLLH